MKAMSFWEMLTSHNIEICIPKIQRDYAQGRIGKELLRERLLKCCKDALHHHDNPQMHLLLDFVYGSKEDDNRYYPLDGQQRLTTLWLLHWYVAYSAQELDDYTRNVLAKFSYETRRSSTDFCKFLCQLRYAPEASSVSLREYILSQTTFSARWTLDPTVSAMLNTLCGTDITDKNNNDIIDGFAELFQGCTKEEFKSYLVLLQSDSCPIRFYNLDMRGENLPLSDDLYIKMNARGKQLTDWENFKADLLDFVHDKEDLGNEIDGCWTDLFWLNQKNGKIDSILFAFINRYIFNHLLCSGLDMEQITKSNLYKLYGKESDDTTLRYEDFSRYKKDAGAEITRTACSRLIHLMRNLYKFIMPAGSSSAVETMDYEHNRLSYLRGLVQSAWGDSDDSFEFLPTYTSGEGVSKITGPQRLVFFAICRYFERVEDFEEEKFKDWVRFAWNISEYIRVEAMANAYRLIDKKSEFCGNIIAHLQTEDPSRVAANSFASEQIKEEIEKAEYITSKPDRKAVVLEAERFRDLHGHIGFLFRDDKEGNVCWDYFDKKFAKLQNLFGVGVKIEKRKQANILKIFLSYCTKVSQIESWTNNYSYIYDYSWESWKANFSNPKYSVPTHKFLTGEKMRGVDEAVGNFEKDKDAIYTDIYRWMLETDIMENVATRLMSGRQRPYLRRYYQELCIYPSAEGVNLHREDRDKLLQSLCIQGVIELNDGDIFSAIDGVRLFLKGWDIYFTYKGESFCWDWNNKLYINNVACSEIEKGISEGDFIALLDSAIMMQENVEEELL